MEDEIIQLIELSRLEDIGNIIADARYRDDEWTLDTLFKIENVKLRYDWILYEYRYSSRDICEIIEDIDVHEDYGNGFYTGILKKNLEEIANIYMNGIDAEGCLEDSFISKEKFYRILHEEMEFIKHDNHLSDILEFLEILTETKKEQ
ncbi:hypothetical protein [Peptostreptococcus faecalis]|uniref:hypothetical protein n=1 Tax=Peptostreptococcus faecalis TaxID=2045015 RepID=UPI000C7AB710|nr:hypothetical protein [Peptostreptococcus faecalis]